MRRILIVINLFSGILALGLLLGVAFYGPVAIVPFERVAGICVSNSSVALQDLGTQLAEAHSGYYQFLSIPLFGVFLIFILSIINVVILVRCKEVVSR
jgi:hypothetical protein